MNKPLGVILAGGKGRRIGGRKAFVTLAGRPLLAHVADRLRPQCSALVVNATDPDGQISALGLQAIADQSHGGAGPLAGVLTAMDWAYDQGAHRVVTAPVDTPFLPPDFCARLSAVEAPICIAETADGWHGTCAIWDVTLRDALRDALSNGTRKVTDFAKAHRAVTCMFPHTTPPNFFNVNTLDDIEMAEAWMM